MKRTVGKLARLMTAMIVAAAAVVIAVWLSGRNGRPPLTGGTAPTGAVVSVRPGQTNAHTETVERIKGAASALRAGGGAEAARRGLEELRGRLSALPREAAVAAVAEALRSGVDAPSGLPFAIGPGGALDSAPSLRTFLLDYLAQLDPAAAAQFARTALATKGSPDEWAVALRCVARAETDEAARKFLEGKMRELLTHEPWRRDPSAGFLEAFDVAVHLRGASLVPELSALVRLTDHRAAAHAAYLALDRLAIADAAPVLAKLADEPELMQGREVTRANFFARADVADGAQRATVERYLLDARRPAEELRTFAGLFPNANFMVSQNLLTPTVTPDRATLAARDRAALRAVNEWLADARFAPLRAELERTRARLEKFVRQTEGR